MSSPSMYTFVDRIDFSDESTSNRRHESATRFQISSSIGINTTSIRSVPPVVHFTDELKSDIQYNIFINHENILFIYLDLQSELTSNLVASLRAINNDVRIFTDSLSCLEFLRMIHGRIFFITSTTHGELIEEFHNIKSVEAMFILNSDAYTDSRFPKLYGVYTHFEELLVALKDTLEWFEQTQMELFVFEHDRIFLWSQVWKEEFIKQEKSKGSFNKEQLVLLAENYYGENIKMHQTIYEFDQSYVKGDALHWCFSSPFPSYFLRRALHSHNVDHLQACRFLLTDVSHVIQLASRKTSCELYKGMKMTNDYLNKLENYIDKLICTKGFLQCSQSRKAALTVANSPDHRPDLVPVLFKITYDTSVPLTELSHKDSTSYMVFDVYTVFRVKYVNRGQLTTIRIEPADDDGKKLAQMYCMTHETGSIRTLLDQILFPPKPPVRLPPLRKTSSSPPPPPVSLDLSLNQDGLSMISEGDDEMQAQELVEHGDIDEAIAIYQQLRPESGRIFNTIALLYAEKKVDYDSAIKYFKKALKIQEKTGEDVSSTLSHLAVIHQNRHEYDLALSCYSRALHKRKKIPNIDDISIANSLIGMANAYWGQQNFTEALKHAQQALELNESIERGNDLNIATNLAIIANIFHNSGDTDKALAIAIRALGLFERYLPSDSPALATLINNVATMQVVKGLLTDAQHSYDRALEIFKKTLPEGHPKRVTMENNIQRIIQMKQKDEEKSHL